MAHKEQIQFCKKVKESFPDYFDGVMALDAGSLDINGNNQYLFSNSHYIGVDIGEGRNVDFIQRIHELAFPDGSFDTIVSSEVFEHDMFYKKSIKNLYRMLKPGGLLLFTCATTGRPEHGTRRTSPENAPFLQSDDLWADYYKNLTEEDIRDVLDVDSDFYQYQFEVELGHRDLNFWGIKKGTYRKRTDSSYLIESSIVNIDLEKKMILKNNEIEELKITVDNLISDNNSLNYKIAIAKDKVMSCESKLSKLEGELVEVYLSRSWRLTRYLRKLSSLIK